MNSRITRGLSLVTFLAAAVLATCFVGTTANAQSAFTGSFTLPYQVQWGLATLPAGDYTLSMPELGANRGEVIVREARTQRAVAHLFFSNREDAGPGGNALLIGTQGSQRVVYSFRVAELGTTYICDASLAHPRRSREEARKFQSVPVLQAKN